MYRGVSLITVREAADLPSDLPTCKRRVLKMQAQAEEHRSLRNVAFWFQIFCQALFPRVGLELGPRSG